MPRRRRRTPPIPARRYRPDDMLTPPEAAAVLRISASTLQQYRLQGHQAIAYVLVGRRVRYRYSDLLAWIESQVVRYSVKPRENAAKRMTHETKDTPRARGVW